MLYFLVCHSWSYIVKLCLCLLLRRAGYSNIQNNTDKLPHQLNLEAVKKDCNFPWNLYVCSHACVFIPVYDVIQLSCAVYIVRWIYCRCDRLTDAIGAILILYLLHCMDVFSPKCCQTMSRKAEFLLTISVTVIPDSKLWNNF